MQYMRHARIHFGRSLALTWPAGEGDRRTGAARSRHASKIEEWCVLNRYPVYIVDDEAPIRTMLEELCEVEGWNWRAFPTGSEFMEAVGDLPPGCVILDMRMPGWNGIKVQSELAQRGAPFAIIAVTGHGDVEMAVESMKLGAIDFIEKPYENDALIEAVGRAFDRLGMAAR